MKRVLVGMAAAVLLGSLGSTSDAGLIADFTFEAAGTFTRANTPGYGSTPTIVDSAVLIDPADVGLTFHHATMVADLSGVPAYAAFPTVGDRSIHGRSGGVFVPGPGGLALIGAAGLMLLTRYRRRAT